MKLIYYICLFNLLLSFDTYSQVKRINKLDITVHANAENKTTLNFDNGVAQASINKKNIDSCLTILFSYLTEIKYLDFVSHSKDTLPPSVFKQKKIKALRLTNITIPSNASLIGMDSLRDIDILNCYFENLDNFFSEKSNLEMIGISHSELKEIPQNILNYPNLKTLSFDYNQINEVPVEICRPSLLFLSLFGNEITEIDKEVIDCINSKYLFLGENPVAKSGDLYKTYPNVKIMPCAGCPIPQK